MTTSSRLLRLLALLQARRDWTGPELADRLEVTVRTIRNDVTRLRDLGYPVTGSPGVAGGYRLSAGHVVPPLLLDDEEAVAVAVGLRLAAGDGGGRGSVEEAALRALVKLDHLLPSRLRPHLRAAGAAVVAGPSGPRVRVDHLLVVAAAVHHQQRLRFDYASTAGATGSRVVEPHQLVRWQDRWYLVAWDLDRDDWRTFRVDRLVPRTPTGPRSTPRGGPPGGALAHVAQGTATAPWRFRAAVRVHAPAERVRQWLPAAVVVEPFPDGDCLAHVGSDSPDALAGWLGLMDADFEVVDSPELADACLRLAERLRSAATR